MTKKLFSFWLAIMAMLCVPTDVQASVNVNFNFMHQEESVPGLYNDASVYIYYNGLRISYAYCRESYDYQTGRYVYPGIASAEISDSYVGKTLAYVSTLGHRGEFTLTETGDDVELQCAKLTVTAKDDDGNPLSNRTISLSGLASLSGRTDAEGQCVIYMAPGDYNWEWDFGSGTIDLSTDQTMELEKVEEQTYYTLSVVGRYGNFPVSGSYSVYKDGNEIWSHRDIVAGSYQIRDKFDGTYDIQIESDTTIYLDYQKVTFVSKSGTAPNVGQNISINSKSAATTNGKGVAEVYLLPGTYNYTVAGGTRKLIVENADMTVDIETVKVAFNINCDDWSNLTFYLNNSEMRPTADGVINYGCLPGREVTLRVSNNSTSTYSPEIVSSSMTVTADVPKTVDLNLYSMMFTANYPHGSIKYESNNYSLVWNKKYYLLAGTYQFSINGESETVVMDKNTVIEKNYAKLTVNVTDTDGKKVEGCRISVKANNDSNSATTDDAGTAILYLPPGNHTLQIGNYELRDISLEGDANENVVIPGIITFTVLSNHLSNLYLYNEVGSGTYAFVSPGEVKGRFDSAKEYWFSGVHGKTKITEGCTVTLGTLSVTSQGNGLAFPMENWDAVSTYDVIVGAPVRLSAIPVGNDAFQKWTINGNDYTNAMIDFKTTAQETVATAVFSGNSSAVSTPVHPSNSLEFSESYITLPGEMEGTARIYTFDGKLVKQLGVVGDQIGIYDLPAGAYVVSFQHGDGVINAQFLKK